jgi:radical SAM/Cys-rich protein
MNSWTAHRIIEKLADIPVQHIEFTGGAPELNPSLPVFIQGLSTDRRTITVRTNLTVLSLAEHARYCELYKTHKIKLVASLPCYLRENVDRQRGKGVFDTSISVLRMLNSIGYGTDGLELDLLYNPLFDALPPDQASLEQAYRRALNDIGVTFNNLIAIANVPVGRFRERLSADNRYDEYLKLLRRNFNAATGDRLMCRSLLTIDYQGSVYDCDFNLALGSKIEGYADTKLWDIDFSDFSPDITFGEHCFACTAGSGSSCHGALITGRTEHTQLLHCELSHTLL